MTTKSKISEIEKHVLDEDQESRDLLERGIFPLSRETLRFISETLSKQIHHTEQIIKLAADQSAEEKKRLHQTLLSIRRMLKDRLIKDLMREIEIRREEEKGISEEEKHGVRSHASLPKVKRIIEFCENFVMILRHELQTLDTIDTYINKDNISGIDELWITFTNFCNREAEIVRQLESNYK